MSTKSKLIYLLLVLIFAFTSLGAGAVAGVQMAAHEMHSDAAYHLDSPQTSSPSFVIAGDCDMSAGCGSGGG